MAGTDWTGALLRPSFTIWRQDERSVRTRSRGLERQSFTLEAIDGSFLERALEEAVDLPIKPAERLRIEIIIQREGTVVEKNSPSGIGSAAVASHSDD
jgi:hypothetical protein